MSIVRGIFSGTFCFLLFVVLVLLGLIISLNLTVLNADFVTAELVKLDVYSTVIDQAKTLIPSQPFIDTKMVDELAVELKPWLQEQASTVIHAVYGYIKEGRDLSLNISLETVRAAVKEKVAAAVAAAPPALLQGATQTQIDAYLSQIYAGIDSAIPSNFVIDGMVAASALKIPLVPIKTAIGYIETAYGALIVTAVLLILLIALAHWWQPKPIARSTGITLVLVGVVCTLGPLVNYILVQFLSQAIGSFGVLTGLQTKLPQLVSALTAPVRSYGIGFLVAGITLVVVSVLLRSAKRSPSNAEA
jgi:hypothetical protein